MTSLHTGGTKIFNDGNEEVTWNGINTRGIFGYWIYAQNGALEEFLGANDVRIIRSHGLNYIRVWIAMDSAVFGQSMGTPDQLDYQPRFWELLDEIINTAEQEGLWIGLDFHISDYGWAGIGGDWNYGSGFPAWMYDGSWPYNKAYANTITARSDAIRDFWNLDNATGANVRQAYQTFWKDIADRYKDRSNVVFSLFNEPMNKFGGPELWTTEAQWTRQAGMYKYFMEQTIDLIRGADGGKHLIVINEAYYWYIIMNLEIQRPNIVIDQHLYWNSDIVNGVQRYADYAWRYDQPFILGEFGDVESGGWQTRESTIRTIQACNQIRVGWMYTRYNPASTGGGPSPSDQTWIDLESNLLPGLIYYDSVYHALTISAQDKDTGEPLQIGLILDGGVVDPGTYRIGEGEHVIMASEEVDVQNGSYSRMQDKWLGKQNG